MSTMGLTPGTPLMAEIERSLEFYICQRLQRFKYLKYELSGARVEVSMHSMSSKTMLMLLNFYSISKADCVQVQMHGRRSAVAWACQSTTLSLQVQKEISTKNLKSFVTEMKRTV